MEVTLISVQVVESQEATIARNFHGLNRKIQIVELHDYTSLSILVHQAIKVELQLKRHGKKSYPNTSSSWKGKGDIASHCKNKRTLVLRENGEVESGSSQEDSASSESESSSVETPYEGDLLMKKHISFKVLGSRKIINVDSLRLVEKLAIPTFPHPKPYKLQWIKIVDKQVSLAITLGLKQAIKEFGRDIHTKEALGLHILRASMTPTNAFTLVLRDLIPCANDLLLKDYVRNH
ncbi:hypothetical protein CR513_42651, partial [Mucuna pruriens]